MEEFYEAIRQLGVFSGLLATRMSQKIRIRRGRPNQQNLGDLVLGLAIVYSGVSGKPFTFQRFKNTAGQYEPITDGHRFVWCLIECLRPQLSEHVQLTGRGVATECERTVAVLRDLNRPRQPRSNKTEKC